MNAIDVFVAASARFPVSFAGALEGDRFRTNITLTDVSGRGSSNSVVAFGSSGLMGLNNVFLAAPTSGQMQYDGLTSQLGVAPAATGAVVMQPVTGQTIASVFVVDNRTNDPTYFPPDLPAPFVRVIPVIGHVDGANNAKFRSDLFLYNPTSSPQTVTLAVKPWDGSSPSSTLDLTMKPKESRILPDVLFSTFGKTGLAQLRYRATYNSTGFADVQAADVRVTSRTYTIDQSGGTYGFLMPPLNIFQQAAPSETLEILGAVGDPRFRTNVGIVDLGNVNAPGLSTSVNIEIIDQKGESIDSFQVSVPAVGGVQFNDIFRARGLGDGPAAAIIRLTPTSGTIGAFASLVDNGTNDSTYLAAQLRAK